MEKGARWIGIIQCGPALEEDTDTFLVDVCGPEADRSSVINEKVIVFVNLYVFFGWNLSLLGDLGDSLRSFGLVYLRNFF